MLSKLVLAAVVTCLSLPAFAAGSTDSYDGTYVGQGVMNQNASPACLSAGASGAMGKKTFVVQGDHVIWHTGTTFPYDTSRIEVPIAPDGSFSGQFGYQFLYGRIKDGHMAAWAGNGTCGANENLVKTS